MAPPRRLVRRAPLSQRLRSYLNPLDFLLWLSEELDSSDWEQWQKHWATPIGVALNILMLVARANSGKTRSRGDDVFGNSDTGIGWMGWFAAFLVHFLSLFSLLNAIYTFLRKRHYRLFEAPIDDVPSTPSAHRVRVDSSPLSSSPLRFLSNMIGTESAEARAHPDASRDVWELSVWDPIPICLKMFCLFSPGHIMIYWLFLPTAAHDSRPSTIVLTTIVLAGLLSLQLTMLQMNFSQQTKDTSLIQKEVLNEYDIKYVHPRTQPVVRSVGTQYSSSSTSMDDDNSVDVYTPITVINRGFHTKPNPNYVPHVDPDYGRRRQDSPIRQSSATPVYQTPAHLRDLSSPIVPNRAQPPIRQPQFRSSAAPVTGDGGSLGAFSHANSPLKKARSTNFGGYRDQEMSTNTAKREGSPLKRSSVPDGMNAADPTNRWAYLQGENRKRESGRF
ncbi:MAG: hypothetical protein MMC33_003225 [Icmadophila ericetorum]|nr:hypothetical protein [Icmadophila ericetorum]